ncbi:hypothetical protein DF3PA_30185 [Candidatus Defluviicoccus seviourii]|uniref:Uncharacterized protein n=1 Tax=Candidatus Defluviicoccus seviourii TaxID=2565273 RepID=A0A564WEP3_9PROT|nr:hypothetical protein DF3PA_30185 [Candidatus Defluviicoccus seviourii]
MVDAASVARFLKGAGIGSGATFALPTDARMTDNTPAGRPSDVCDRRSPAAASVEGKKT